MDRDVFAGFDLFDELVHVLGLESFVGKGGLLLDVSLKTAQLILFFDNDGFIPGLGGFQGRLQTGDPRRR